MKKLWIVLLSAVCLALCAGFAGCKNEGPIPDGNYGFTGAVYTFKYTDGDVKDTYGWIIEGDTVERWVSGSRDYKAKIVRKDGQIIFDGYKYRDFLDILLRGGAQSGSNHDYTVVYDEIERAITLTPVSLDEGA